MAFSSSSKRSTSIVSRLLESPKDKKVGYATAAGKLNSVVDTATSQGRVDISKWRNVNSRIFGLDLWKIPQPLRTVMKILRGKDFQCYLVGGCVRDLLLKRAPKDFDVITTANLEQIKKTFHRAVIIGQRFPVCLVHIGGSEIEVSSFDTVANTGLTEKVGKSIPQLLPESCNKTDVLLYTNSLVRDFTINSLFFDPFGATIYDYTGGMEDLKSLELRTLGPAYSSFQEDHARILRGLRIAARLGLSVSPDTATAIHQLSSSILELSKFRINMELDYMLSYGASQASLCLLERFKLLKVFFPLHALILDKQTSEGLSLGSTMLMRLFSNLDNILACNRPGHCTIWISLLAFHQALNNKPQELLVIWTFASLLCFKEWSRSVDFAKECAQKHQFSAPEILKSPNHINDEELADKVSELASLVTNSINTLTDKDTLRKSMSRFRNPTSSPLVFVPGKCGSDSAKLFYMFGTDIKSFTSGKRGIEINYESLKKGAASETRFVLGQVIMDTLIGKVNQGLPHRVQEINNEHKAYNEKFLGAFGHFLAQNAMNQKNSTNNDKKLEVGVNNITVNSDSSWDDLDAVFLEELGPVRFQKSEEGQIKVARISHTETPWKPAVSENMERGTKLLSKRSNLSQRMGPTNDAKQNAIKVSKGSVQLGSAFEFPDDSLKNKCSMMDKMHQDSEDSLQLGTAIKFPDDRPKKNANVIDTKLQGRLEERFINNGHTKESPNTIKKKTLSSIFMSQTTRNSAYRDVVEDGDSLQPRLRQQVQGGFASCEERKLSQTSTPEAKVKAQTIIPKHQVPRQGDASDILKLLGLTSSRESAAAELKQVAKTVKSETVGEQQEPPSCQMTAKKSRKVGPSRSKSKAELPKDELKTCSVADSSRIRGTAHEEQDCALASDVEKSVEPVDDNLRQASSDPTQDQKAISTRRKPRKTPPKNQDEMTCRNSEVAETDHTEPNKKQKISKKSLEKTKKQDTPDSSQETTTVKKQKKKPQPGETRSEDTSKAPEIDKPTKVAKNKKKTKPQAQ